MGVSDIWIDSEPPWETVTVTSDMTARIEIVAAGISPATCTSIWHLEKTQMVHRKWKVKIKTSKHLEQVTHVWFRFEEEPESLSQGQELQARTLTTVSNTFPVILCSPFSLVILESELLWLFVMAVCLAVCLWPFAITIANFALWKLWNFHDNNCNLKSIPAWSAWTLKALSVI